MKSKTIQIRISEEEKEQLEQQAASLGLTVSAYVRMIVKQKIEIVQLNQSPPYL